MTDNLRGRRVKHSGHLSRKFATSQILSLRGRVGDIVSTGKYRPTTQAAQNQFRGAIHQRDELAAVIERRR